MHTSHCSRHHRCGGRTLAVVLSLSLVVGIAPVSALAAEGEDTPEATELTDQAAAQISLAEDETPAPENVSGGGALNAYDESQVEESLPLGQAPAPALVGTVVLNGLTYDVDGNAGTASLVGWREGAPEGELVIPSEVASGQDSYRVTAVSSRALAGCDKLASVFLPASIDDVAQDAFADCPALERILVPEASAAYSSTDGMLFDKEARTLVLVPAGKQGTARIPTTTENIDPTAFAGCSKISAVQVDAESAAFASVAGALYSADRTELMFRPAGAGTAAVISPETLTIKAGAFPKGSTLESIASPGFVETIEQGAFPDEAKDAVVALAAQDERRAVWEHAGFSHFAEIAPADTPAVQTPGFTYELQGDCTLSVSWTGDADPDAQLTIPETAELDGVTYRVSTIAPGAFAGRNIESAKIPASVTSIGAEAFSGCARLSSVEFAGGGGLTELGSGAFEGTALESIVLPATLTSVGGRAFADCTNLKRIVALSDVAFVDDSALAGCAGASIYCPQTSAGGGAASPWYPGLPASGNHVLTYGLALADEPLNLTVGETADLFAGGTKDVPEGVEVSYSYAAGPLSVDAGTVAAKAPGASEVAVTLTLDGIELARASRLVQVKRGEAATAPEGSPIVRTTVPLLAQTLSASADDAGISTLAVGQTFEVAANNYTFKCTVLTDPADSEPGTVSIAKGASASYPTAALGTLTIPDTVTNDGVQYTVTEIADEAFNRGSSTEADLCKLSVPNTVTRIGTNAFRAGRFSGTLTLPASVEEIGADAFMSNNFTSISFPSKTMQLGKEVFMSNSKLTSVTIPEGMDVVGARMFNTCKELKTIVVSGGAIGDSAFSSCATLESVTLKEGVTSIGTTAFTSDTALKGSITFPGTVTSIGDKAFSGCSGLTSISFAEHMSGTSIGKEAFKGSGLSGALDFPEGVESIGDNAFQGLSNITSVTFHDQSVKSIGASAFIATGIKGPLVLPSTLESIGNYAFRNITGITSVKLSSNLTSIAQYAFGGNTALTGTVILPPSLQTIEANAFNQCPIKQVLDCSACNPGANPFYYNKTTNPLTVYCLASRESLWKGRQTGATIVPCTSSISKSSETLVKSESTLTATFTGLADSPFASSAKVEWASEDASIVSVTAGSNGQATITPVANGKKKVTATQAVNGVPFMSESCEVTVERFKTVKFDTGDGGSAVASQDVETGDKATKPEAIPERTGYTFVDWYASLTDEKPFDFKNTAIESDTTLHAKWALVISYDAPADATVSVDADGTTSVSKVSFKSKAAAPVEIVAVASTAQEGVSQLFPDEDSRKNLKLSVAPPGGGSVSFPLSAPADALTSGFLKGKGFTIEANGTIELAYSLVIPSGTRMNYLGDATDGTPLASIAYKLAAVEEGAAA